MFKINSRPCDIFLIDDSIISRDGGGEKNVENTYTIA